MERAAPLLQSVLLSAAMLSPYRMLRSEVQGGVSLDRCGDLTPFSNPLAHRSFGTGQRGGSQLLFRRRTEALGSSVTS